MAVTVQGYLALDLVKKNNVELVKGVDRASTTTVGALKTAITVAQAMTNQKLVLEQYMRSRIDSSGYQEIKTPQLMDARLWEASGHWGKFRENMRSEEPPSGCQYITSTSSA